jgi:hypothetical protein
VVWILAADEVASIDLTREDLAIALYFGAVFSFFIVFSS